MLIETIPYQLHQFRTPTIAIVISNILAPKSKSYPSLFRPTQRPASKTIAVFKLWHLFR